MLTKGNARMPSAFVRESTCFTRIISATKLFPPLVGAMYTRLCLPSNTPGMLRHRACHGCRALIPFFLKAATAQSGNPKASMERSQCGRPRSDLSAAAATFEASSCPGTGACSPT
eukprot:scaffold2534_cov364-Prasinococcus_capsulatus_cf.AAC.2